MYFPEKMLTVFVTNDNKPHSIVALIPCLNSGRSYCKDLRKIMVEHLNHTKCKILPLISIKLNFKEM